MNTEEAPEEIVGRPPPIAEDSWDEFRKAGLMWWVNRQLHLFGWALCVDVNPDDPEKTLRAYPVKTTFRGFCADAEERGFKALTAYIETTGADLRTVTDELDPPPLGDHTPSIPDACV